MVTAEQARFQSGALARQAHARAQWGVFVHRLVLILLMIPTLFVFFWMISLSLKDDVQNTASPPVFIPTTFKFDNYLQVFETQPFARYALNSLLVGLGSTGLALVLGVPAAYGIAKWKQYGLSLVVLFARMVPGISFLIPWFLLFRNLGWSNTYQALILTHMIVSLPTVVWIMLSFFEDIHPELEEAAYVDGCGPYGAFWRITLPLALPGVAVAAILSFILSWNNFIFSVILGGPNTRTLPVAVFNMMSFEQVVWGPLAAAALIVTLPVLVLTLFVQRYIVAGISAGAVKG